MYCIILCYHILFYNYLLSSLCVELFSLYSLVLYNDILTTLKNNIGEMHAGGQKQLLLCVFVAVASTVKQALQDSLVQILQPKRRVDILRDVMEAQSQRRPFVITFCGVNGVGKSTNLAKVSGHC